MAIRWCFEIYPGMYIARIPLTSYPHCNKEILATTVDAIVIGAGEAGALVASKAVSAGYTVAMAYHRPYGSTCLNTGCVPSKYLIHRARIAHLTRTAQRFHVHTSQPSINLPGLIDEKNTMLDAHRSESFSAAQAADGLIMVEGSAQFISPHEVEINGQRFVAGKIFIATGMRPSIPAIEGIDQVPPLTNETLMQLHEVPGHLVCIGGGYIACELGQAFRRFGSEVTIVQRAEHLCPSEEPDVSTLLERALEADGIRLLLNHSAERIERTADGVRLEASSPAGRQIVEGTHLLVAAGRTPNTDMLRLEQAGLATDEKGYIKVDDQLRTNIEGIWAIGDVNGLQPFTRVCQEEAKVAYNNAFEGGNVRMRREFLGHAVFTDPPIGSVGLTERQAREADEEVAVGLVTFDKVEKAEIIGETTGLIKYVVEKQSRRLLGCHIIGPDADNLIYTAIVVMRHQGTLDELALAVGIFPTLHEGVEGTARGLLRKIEPELVAGPLVA